LADRTSRARHVKCDEGKPSCTRCTTAARRCEGYQAPSARAPSSSLKIIFHVPRPQDFHLSLGPFQGNEKERRAFAFFCEQTAKCFQSEFSSLYLLRATNEEPAILHAVIALGGIHEIFGLYKERLNGITPIDQFSERQYYKAIALLLDSTKISSEHSTELVLLCCILFACFESLRGRIKSAITHVRCGLNLLHQTETTNTRPSFAYIPQKIVKSLFTRLENQMMELESSSILTMSRETERPTFSELKDPEIFRNLETAYESFDIFLNRTLHVNRTLETLLVDPLGFLDSETLLEIEIERAKCLQYLDGWSRAFNQYLIGDGPVPKQISDYNVYVLQIWRVTAKIFLSVKPTNAEETWDQFQQEFNTIVTLAETLAETSYITDTSCQGTPSFSFHLGILPPLFLTSVRCRDPIIRRRAVHVLFSSRRCEAIWDSHLAAAVAGLVIETEEKHVWQSAQGIGTSHSHNFSEENIRAYTRVKEVVVAYDDGTLPEIKFTWER
jgi:hypothetical protein